MTGEDARRLVYACAMMAGQGQTATHVQNRTALSAKQCVHGARHVLALATAMQMELVYVMTSRGQGHFVKNAKRA